MSHIPLGWSGNFAVPEKAKELKEEQQWERCRRQGFNVNVHWDGNKIDAWIRADEVEKMLTPILGPDISEDAIFENPQETKAP